VPLYTSRYVDDGNDDAYSDGGSERTTNTDDGDSVHTLPTCDEAAVRHHAGLTLPHARARSPAVVAVEVAAVVVAAVAVAEEEEEVVVVVAPERLCKMNHSQTAPLLWALESESEAARGSPR
jgi:hypothetical protein